MVTETDAGEDYDADGNISDVQESQSQQSQLRRSDTGLSRMRSESGESHTEEECVVYAMHKKRKAQLCLGLWRV